MTENENNTPFEDDVNQGRSDLESYINGDRDIVDIIGGNGTPTPQGAPTPGISSAYIKNAPRDIYGNVKLPENNSKHEDTGAQKRENKPLDLKGETPMEISWDIFKKILNGAVDWTVDKILDAFDYLVLPKGGKPNKNITNIYALGLASRNANDEEGIKKGAVSLAGYKEFLDNLENDKNSRPVKWNILKTEPSFFKEISEIYKKDPSARTKDENIMMHLLQNAPVEEFIEQERHIRGFAIDAATCDLGVQKERGDILCEGSGDVMKALEKAVKDNDRSTALLWVQYLTQNIAQDGDLLNGAKLDLMHLKDALDRGASTKETSKLFENLVKTQNDLKENPDMWTERLHRRSKEYQDKIRNRIIGIKTQDKHTVSKEFTDELYELGAMFGQHTSLTPDQKKAETSRLITEMTAHLDDTKPGHQALKQKLTELGVAISGIDVTAQGAEAIINNVANGFIKEIDVIHKENDPKEIDTNAFLTELVKSCVKAKETRDICAGKLGVIHKTDKIKAMNEALTEMRGVVEGTQSSPQPQNTINADTFIYDIINAQTR